MKLAKTGSLLALLALTGLAGCAEPKADEDCTRLDAMRGALASGCSPERLKEINRETLRDGAGVLASGAVAVGRVAAPVAGAAIKVGAPVAATAISGPIAGAATRAVANNLF